jgi:hypothetical protein
MRHVAEVDQLLRGDCYVVAAALDLVRPICQHRGERLGAGRHQCGMCHPGTVEAITGFPRFVGLGAFEGNRRRIRIGAAGHEGGHAADGVRAALVAGLDQQFGVRPHEWHRHGDARPVR